MKASDLTLQELMVRLLAKPGHASNPSVTDALAHCVLNAAGETAGCPLSRLFLLDYAGSAHEHPHHVKRTIGDRLHTLLMGEAMWGKNTRYLHMLLSCERFAGKDPACSLHQVLNPTRSPSSLHL
jgi:hypothetical protein